MHRIEIVSTKDRPDLVPIVAGWLWQETWQALGHSADDTLAMVSASIASAGLPQTLVLLIDGLPTGTASLVAQDLEQRPDLTPWLAWVYIVPDARRQGHAARLVAAVEHICRRDGVAALWLFTRTAEDVYLKIGWVTVEAFQRNGRTYALMRRDLTASP